MRNGKANIMVVDDDARTLRMMEAMLTPQGYRVTTAKDGQEAVDLDWPRKTGSGSYGYDDASIGWTCSLPRHKNRPGNKANSSNNVNGCERRT